MKLRIELEAWDGRTVWAEYDTFRLDLETYNIQINLNKLNIDKSSRVEGEDQGYRLHIGGYRGTAGDSLARSPANNGMKFTTRDRDNDKWSGNCAQGFKGGWWFNGYYYTNVLRHLMVNFKLWLLLS